MFHPNSSIDEKILLEKTGVKSYEELLKNVPAKHLNPGLGLPNNMSELERTQFLQGLANKNILPLSFLGAGGVARPGGQIVIDGKNAGTVASGTFSPSLNLAIGLAYFPASLPKEGTRFKILQGTRELDAVTIKTPFYKKI